MTINQTISVGGVTITINAEDAAFLTLETAISIVLALSPLGIVALPAWALIILPAIKAELPLTETLLNDLAAAIEANQETKTILNYIHNAFNFWKTQSYANTENIWPTLMEKE